MSSIILGIDPGLAITGFGVLESRGREDQKVLGYGAIRTPAGMSLPSRLMEIRQELQTLLAQFKPDAVGVEKLYFGKNAKTAMAVGQARGVVLLTLSENNIPIYEYTPLQIKMALTGYGRADKAQVQQLVQQLLRLSEIPKPDDAADGLAIALTAIMSEGIMNE
ncbi:crossover junction endodeoxyribonuclease RuvC [candidate division WWE3 bacterium]|uniref:Crossover junction endodeoxyribonuclease RuvC n=1 Tax=candidate division WWE3 bacterium TaxID=2053526 RepID=A0A955LV88_UNCKA|nr:crossover junction endodeoxyribonuclease RuvC [candidate division WWE3 bacterium]